MSFFRNVPDQVVKHFHQYKPSDPGMMRAAAVATSGQLLEEKFYPILSVFRGVIRMTTYIKRER